MPTVQYIAQPILDIDGQSAPNDLMDSILQISVEESLHLPGMFTIVVNNDYFPGRAEDQAWRFDDLLMIGKRVKIGFESSTTEAQEFSEANRGYVLEGEITAIETHFTSESQAPVIVRGYDRSHRLHRGRFNRSFQNMSDTDIVKKIAEEVRIDIGTVDESGGPYGYGDINGANGYVFQENQTNMEFLRERAARNGFELFVQDGKLHFRKPKVNESLALKWLRDLHTFRTRITSAEQVNQVEVRGWDYSRKEPIVEIARVERSLTETEHGRGSSASRCFQGQSNAPSLVVVDQSLATADEAKKMSQAVCDELGGEFVHADAKAEGNPHIRPGKVVDLKDMGKFSGKYYVTETRHLFHGRIYTTEFSVRGARGSHLLSILSPQNRHQSGQTLLIGKVTNNQDPNGWGRVRVKFPTLTEEHESYWARVVSTGAGANRGLDCLPEINDEVLVAFEHGDIHRPYIIGGVWNGRDAPPAAVGDSVQGGKVRLRTFRSRTGHQLQFVEEDKGSSKAGVYIETKGGHKVRINDSDMLVEIETAGGHKLSLSDRDRNITLSSTGTMKLSAQAQIEISAPTVKVSGSGLVDVKGGMIKLN